MTVSYPDHPTTPRVNVNVSAGVTTTQNFTLRLQKPCLSVQPVSLTAAVQFGLSTTLPLTLNNGGATSLAFTLAEAPSGAAGKDVLVVRHDTTMAARHGGRLTALGYTFDGTPTRSSRR